jgi:hypothetical protein
MLDPQYRSGYYRYRARDLILSGMKGTEPNPLKRQLIAAVKAGQELDLSTYPEPGRTLLASDLLDILRNRSAVTPSAHVRLRSVVIEGDLDLSQVDTGLTLTLTNCQRTNMQQGDGRVPRFTVRADSGRSRWLQGARALRGLIGKEPALITALLFSFVVIKVIWIARGDIPTALGIFDRAGLATVIAGGLLSAFPLIPAIIFGIAMFELGRSLLHDKFALMIGCAAAVGGFFLTPWTIMACGAVLGLVSGFLVEKAAFFRKAIFVFLLLGSLFLLNPLLYAVWLPHETLTIGNPGRQQSAVGYVLSDSNGWVSLLRTGQRRIYRYRSEDVKARTLCRARSFSWPFAPPWLNNPSSLWNIIFPGENTKLLSC